jgi:hypothetical protein
VSLEQVEGDAENPIPIPDQGQAVLQNQAYLNLATAKHHVQLEAMKMYHSWDFLKKNILE